MCATSADDGTAAVTKIDRIETTIVDLPTIRGHVLSMTTMMVQSMVLVRVRFADGSTARRAWARAPRSAG